MIPIGPNRHDIIGLLSLFTKRIVRPRQIAMVNYTSTSVFDQIFDQTLFWDGILRLMFKSVD